MAATLNTPVLRFQVQSLLSNTVGLATVSAPLDQTWDFGPLANGTSGNQADKLYTATVTIGPSSSATIDVAGSVADALGSTMTLARVKLVAIKASSTNDPANLLQISQTTIGVPLFGTSAATVSLRPGGGFIYVQPDITATAVTAATADIIGFANSAGTNTITASVIIIGASA